MNIKSDIAITVGFILGVGAALCGTILFFLAINGQVPMPHPVAFSVILTLGGTIAAIPGIQELR